MATSRSLPMSEFEALSMKVDAQLSAIFDGYHRGEMTSEQACAVLRRVDAALQSETRIQPSGKAVSAVRP